MLLFNLIFVHSLKSPNSPIKYYDSNVKFPNRTFSKDKMLLFSLPILTSHCNILNISQDNLADKEFISRNFLTKLINNFWQQTIFLSVPTKLSEKYIAQLNSLNLTNTKISQKKFLSQFSKSLINGSIQSSLSYPLMDGQLSSSIKYVWKKSWLNFNYPVSWKKSRLLKGIPNQSKHKINNLPLFIVTNCLNQMIVAEPSRELFVNSEVTKEYIKPYYQAWFFTNYEDAQEYLEYIKNQYSTSDASNPLRIFISNLETFYKLSNKSKNTMQFRLVPDLHEIGELVTNYSSYRNIKFNKNQNYGKNYFQGQPVYVFNNNKFYYETTKNNQQIQYKPVFTNYKTAMLSYRSMIKKTQSYKLSKEPDIVVYNLEDFLNEQIHNSDTSQMPFLLIPSQSSYEFTKTSQTKQINGFMYHDFSGYLSHLSLSIKRLIWSLTSRQPYD